MRITRITFRDALHSSAEETIEFVIRKHRDWFDENDPIVQDFLDRLHHAHISYVMDKSSQSKKASYLCFKREAQATLRDIKNRGWKDRADDLQFAYDRKNSKALFALRAVHGPSSQRSTPLFTADGQTLTKDPTSILNRWAEHFKSVRVSRISDESIDQLPQRPIHEELDGAPTEAKTIKAVKQLS